MSSEYGYNASLLNSTVREPLLDTNASQIIHFRTRSFRISDEEKKLLAAITSVRQIVTPSLILFGLIGNILAFVILHKSPVLRQSSVWFYLKAFFVTSTLVLLFGAGLDWIYFMSKLRELWNVTDALCKVWQFLSSVLFYSPIWFCVAMTIDRYVSICHPRTSETICNVFAAKITLIFIMIGLIIVSVHAMWTFELDLVHGCTIIPGHDFHSVVWPWVSLIIYTFLPVSLLLIFNTVVCIALCSKHKCRKPETSPHTRVQDNEKFTASALIVSTTYLMLTMPATIMNVYMVQAPPEWVTTREEYRRLELLNTIFQQFAILNHAFMAVICLCSSAVFRRETYTLFLKRVQHDSIEVDLEEYCSKYGPSNGSVVQNRTSLL